MDSKGHAGRLGRRRGAGRAIVVAWIAGLLPFVVVLLTVRGGGTPSRLQPAARVTGVSSVAALLTAVDRRGEYLVVVGRDELVMVRSSSNGLVTERIAYPWPGRLTGGVTADLWDRNCDGLVDLTVGTWVDTGLRDQVWPGPSGRSDAQLFSAVYSQRPGGFRLASIGHQSVPFVREQPAPTVYAHGHEHDLELMRGNGVATRLHAANNGKTCGVLAGYAIDAGDFNGDLDDEVLTFEEDATSATYRLYSPVRGGGWRLVWQREAPIEALSTETYAVTGARVTDLNGDGLAELAVVDLPNAAVEVLTWGEVRSL